MSNIIEFKSRVGGRVLISEMEGSVLRLGLHLSDKLKLAIERERNHRHNLKLLAERKPEYKEVCRTRMKESDQRMAGYLSKLAVVRFRNEVVYERMKGGI